MTRFGGVAGSALLMALTGCGSSIPAPEPLTVAVQNLYVGADLARLLSAESGPAVLESVSREYANIARNDFPERAAAIAGWLAATRPHLVGLQEASLFRRQSPGDVLVGNAVAASEVEMDFLQILLAELESAGVAYREVARYAGLDVEVPLPLPDGTVDDVRLTDHGVILARDDVVTRDPESRVFDTNMTVRLGGEGGWQVEATGGWASVEASIDGSPVRFVTTHLESGDLAPAIQMAQTEQLLAALASDSLPIVMVGDFSSTPDGRMTGTFESVIAAGFADAWAVARPGEGGATCCQAADIRNDTSELSRRLDFIFYRDPSPGPTSPLSGPVTARLFGATAAERTDSGLWPSDHAGILARFGAGSGPR